MQLLCQLGKRLSMDLFGILKISIKIILKVAFAGKLYDFLSKKYWKQAENCGKRGLKMAILERLVHAIPIKHGPLALKVPPPKRLKYDRRRDHKVPATYPYPTPSDAS